MAGLLTVPVIVSSSDLHLQSVERLASNLRAVEQVRYAVTVGTAEPFDQVYPREVFRQLAAEANTKERLLASYGEKISTHAARRECDRIDRGSKAPALWLAMKKALNDDEDVIVATICRPLLVDHQLRFRFGADPNAHTIAMRATMLAREKLLRGDMGRGRGWFRNVSLCGDEPDCHGISKSAAVVAIEQFQGGSRVSSILQTEETFFVLRRTGVHNIFDGFECLKADYHSWVRGHLVPSSRSR